VFVRFFKLRQIKIYSCPTGRNGAVSKGDLNDRRGGGRRTSKATYLFNASTSAEVVLNLN